MRVPEPERDGDSITFRAFAASWGIIAMPDGLVLNVVSIPPPDLESSGEVLVDLFDPAGRFLATRSLPHSMVAKCRDSSGRVYFVDNSEYPRVVRYTMKVTEVQ